jgi:hypothetical protein
MARLKLSPSGLRSPLDLPTDPAPAVPADAEPRVTWAVSRPVVAPVATRPAAAAAPPALADDAWVLPADAPVAEPTPAPVAQDDPIAAPVAAAAEPTPAPTAEAPSPEPPAAPAASPDPAPAADPDALPAWAAALDPAALAPTRLLGRPKQTALIMARELSTRADELVAATGPRVTFAAVVTAVLHFHLPADGEAAARTIGAYRRRRLDTLDHPWEERNARLPEPLRAELDEVVAGATGRVASVHRSTLVNALLDAHLPATPEDASRLVTRMEMVRGGAFLDLVG